MDRVDLIPFLQPVYPGDEVAIAMQQTPIDMFCGMEDALAGQCPLPDFLGRVDLARRGGAAYNRRGFISSGGFRAATL